MGVALGKVCLLQLIDSARLWLGLSLSGTSKVASVAPAGNSESLLFGDLVAIYFLRLHNILYNLKLQYQIFFFT